MSSDTSSVRITALILRVTLGVIFVWHGVDKVRSDPGSWGAGWTEVMLKRHTEPPADAMTKLEKLPASAWLTDEEKGKVNEAEAEKLAEVRRKTVEAGLRHAYVADSPSGEGTLRSAAVQYAVTWGEILGGVALILGVLTRLAALGLMVIQLGAIYFVTRQLGLTGEAGVGYEYNLVLIAACLALVILGAGAWSVDRFLHWGRKEPRQQEAAAQQPVATAS
jgi:uncharacterized membrane protein YphA (DoxX/SURF4 family)